MKSLFVLIFIGFIFSGCAGLGPKPIHQDDTQIVINHLPWDSDVAFKLAAEHCENQGNKKPKIGTHYKDRARQVTTFDCK